MAVSARITAQPLFVETDIVYGVAGSVKPC